jgi:uncharacterized damage-inducible protein DinB
MTPVPEPFLTAARDILRRRRRDVRAAIEGLTADGLNWRPAGPDTNSIAVIATHVTHSTRTWLSVAVGEPLPGRDRPAEFETTASDAGQLLAFVDETFDACLALVDGSRTADWSAVRNHWDPGQDVEVSAAWALLHALEHLREHIGHMSLTRQLWDQREAAP